MKNSKTGEYINSENLKVHPRMKELCKFFKYNGKLVDITHYNPDFLDIFSREVLVKIEKDEEGWEQMLPEGVSEIIKRNHLFNYRRSAEKIGS